MLAGADELLFCFCDLGAVALGDCCLKILNPRFDFWDAVALQQITLEMKEFLPAFEDCEGLFFPFWLPKEIGDQERKVGGVNHALLIEGRGREGQGFYSLSSSRLSSVFGEIRLRACLLPQGRNLRNLPHLR